MTPDEVAAVVSKHFSTFKGFDAALAQMANSAAIRALDAQIDGLQAKQTEVLAPIQNERLELVNQRAALIEKFKTV